MFDLLTRNWWALALRGAASVLFGLLALAWPGLTAETLVILFCAYSLTDGALAIVKAVSNRRSGGWWSLLLNGLAGVAIGVITFVAPGAAALSLLAYVAGRAIASGAMEVVAAVRLRERLPNEWLLAVDGAGSILFGAVCLAWPGATALALVWLIAFHAVAVGILLIALAFRLRGLEAKPAGTVPAAA